MSDEGTGDTSAEAEATISAGLGDGAEAGEASFGTPANKSV